MQGPTSYGGREGLYEIAVLHGDDWVLCYATTITDDVVGWLSEEEVVKTLHQIAALESDNECSHDRPDEEGSEFRWTRDGNAPGLTDVLDSALEMLRRDDD